MATEIFTDDVQILGTEDEVQLQVQGTDGQTAPLQTWQDHTGDVQAQMTAEGRLQVGEPGMSTPDALLEANRETSSVLPERGFHSLGRINAALSSAIAWLVGELELLGTGDLSGIQRLLRAVLTHASTGDSSEAEVRAADFEVINQSGDEFYPLGKAVVLEADLDNQAGAFLDEGRGLSVRLQNSTGAEIGTFKAMEVQAPVNDGTISTLIGLDIADMNEGTDNYALRTGAGKVQFGELGTGLVKANASGLLSNAVAGTDFDVPMQGATDTLDGEAGIVPQPLAGDEDKFLRGDGTWADASLVAALDDLSDVDTSGAATDDVLGFNGTTWVPQALPAPSSNPIAAIILYAGANAPTGWLLCNGAAVSRTTYADLFTAIGTSYGVGDGSTTFNLPDLRGRSAVGAGQGSGLTNRALGASFGEEEHQLTVTEMPAHKHILHGNIGGGSTFNGSHGVVYSRTNVGTVTNSANYMDASGGDVAHNNMQPSLALNYIIKA